MCQRCTFSVVNPNVEVPATLGDARGGPVQDRRSFRHHMGPQQGPSQEGSSIKTGPTLDDLYLRRVHRRFCPPHYSRPPRHILPIG